MTFNTTVNRAESHDPLSDEAVISAFPQGATFTAGADRHALSQSLRAQPLAVAVSGGIDSLSLVVAAMRVGADVQAFHARSAAVPSEATARTRELCGAFGISLFVVDANEFADSNYTENPHNRCYFCKSHLYDTIKRHTDRRIASGTNLDDLSDHRPGLVAASERGVFHPLAEANFTKHDVRQLARLMGLASLSELPAQPCLSSRVETGVAIAPTTLSIIDDVERLLRAELPAHSTVRCRIKKAGVVIELDPHALATLQPTLLERVRATVVGAGINHDVTVAPYRMGSAFLRVVA